MHRLSDEKEALERLRNVGFTGQDISRFWRMHKTYGQDEMDQTALDERRLEFARWLVATGRLTEQK